MAGMDERSEPIEAEIARIAELPAGEKWAALEALEAQLRASLDDIPSA